MCPLTDDLWVISFIGRDRPGLIRDILNRPALQNVNIVDMDQRVMQGICVMTVVADFASAETTPGKLEQWYQDNAERLAIDFSFLPLEGHQGRRQSLGHRPGGVDLH